MYGFIDGSDGRFNSVEDAMSEVEKYVLNINYSPVALSDANESLDDFSFFSMGTQEGMELYNRTNSEWELYPFDPECLYSGEGVLSPIKRFGKRVIRKCIGWYIHPMTERLNRYNADALRLMNEYGKALEYLYRENRHLSERLLEAQKKRALYDDYCATYASMAKEKDGDAAALCARYADLLKEKSMVVDLGCGCGDLLLALQERGVTRCYGVDRSGAMVQQCHARGAQAIQADAVEYLSNLKNRSAGAIACLELLEDNSGEYIFELLGKAFQKLEYDGLLLISACNPLAVDARCDEYHADPSRNTLIHPTVLKAMVEHMGFEVEGTALANPGYVDCELDETPSELMAGHKNYVLVCRKPSK